MLDNNCKEHEIAGTVIGHQEPWLARIPAVSGYPKQNDEYVGSLGRQRWAGVSQVKIICTVWSLDRASVPLTEEHHTRHAEKYPGKLTRFYLTSPSH